MSKMDIVVETTGGFIVTRVEAAQQAVAEDRAAIESLVFSVGKQYATLALFKDDVAAGYTPAIGAVVTAGGVQYEYIGGSADPLGELPGWRLFGVNDVDGDPFLSTAEQTLTAPQQEQARENIGIPRVPGKFYTTRAAFVSDAGYVNGANAPIDGTVVTAGGLQYVRSEGATVMSSNTVPSGHRLPGWLPFGTATFRHFGAVGDGVADDYLFIRHAMFFTPFAIDPEGLTYKINTALDGIPGTIIGDMVIDASDVPNATAWTMTGASFETAIDLSTTLVAGSRQCNALAHGYSAGDVVVIRSNEKLETVTNSDATHWAQVEIPTTNTFQLSHRSRCIIRSTEGGRVQRLPEVLDVDGIVRRVDFRGRVEIIGSGPSGSCLAGISATRLIRPNFGTCVFRDTTVRGLSMLQCFMPRYERVEGYNCNRAGLGYAVNINGCGWSEVGTTFGDNCRHVLTYGASIGIATIGGTYGDVIGHRSVGATFDTHPGVLALVGLGRVFGDQTDDPNATDGSDGAGQEAITMQGEVTVDAVITGRCTGQAALIQPGYNPAVFSAGYFPSFSLKLDAREVAGGSDAILVDVLRGCTIESIEVDYRANASGAARASLRVSKPSADPTPTVNRLVIHAIGKSADSRGIYIIGSSNASGVLVRSVAISGYLESGSEAEEAIRIIGNSASENQMKVTATNLHLKSANRALLLQGHMIFQRGAVIEDAPNANSIVSPAVIAP